MIPGFIVALATFPGVIVHEVAHMLFCKLRGLAVLDVCFVRFGNPAGYVVHEPPKDFVSSFLVAVGPLIVNSVLCIVFCFPAFVPVRVFDQPDPISYFLIWLGVSIGMHAFPSQHDANNLWQAAKEAARVTNPVALLSFPLVVVITSRTASRSSGSTTSTASASGSSCRSSCWSASSSVPPARVLDPARARALQP